jgi:hypothetical protein
MQPFQSAGTLSDGNLTFTSSQGASAYPAFYSTIGASQGKWYAEFKVTTANSAVIGIGSGIGTGGFLVVVYMIMLITMMGLFIIMAVIKAHKVHIQMEI